MIKLPKIFAAHPHAALIEAYFADAEAPLREGGTVCVARWPFDEPVRRALGVARAAGHLAQGLEQIEKLLDREQKGLRAVQEKTGQAPAQRMSRLLVLASDGSDRFYRGAESLLARHADRAWGCVVGATAEELGSGFTDKGKPARALLVDDRAALEAALTALGDALASGARK